jgi:hypothetical protein
LLSRAPSKPPNKRGNRDDRATSKATDQSLSEDGHASRIVSQDITRTVRLDLGLCPVKSGATSAECTKNEEETPERSG